MTCSPHASRPFLLPFRRLAEFTVPGEKGVHNILFRNRQGKLKLGTRVTVVFGSIRKEHLQLQE